jgi:aminomethyltransferase
MNQDKLIKTPFYDKHIQANAKMIEFAGFIMPIQYKGMVSEHLAVRENIGLFDLSHMGEFEVSGTDALAFLEKTTTNDVSSLEPGKIQYSCMPNEKGGIVDDLLIYCIDKDSYFLVVNGANIEKDYKWLQYNLFGDVELKNISNDTALLAIQGPNAQKLLEKLTDYEIENMGYYTHANSNIAGENIFFSRTGYTGEDGFELYFDPQLADTIWNAVTRAGEPLGLELIGLGARDTLRLEMKMALYGNDITDTTSPVEAGLSWIVNFEKDFIGSEIIKQHKLDKPKRRLICLELEGRAFPRHGYEIYDGDQLIGEVTSGTFSPTLQKPIALGYLPRLKTKSGTNVEVAIRNKRFNAVVVKPPFYKNASHR